MRSRRRKINRSTIETRNYEIKHRLKWMREHLRKIDEDADNSGRIAVGLCPQCFYEKSRIGGSAVTSVQCAFCDEILTFGNTNVNILCGECAEQAGLCCHCGADLNLKNRRKLELPDPTANRPDPEDQIE